MWRFGDELRIFWLCFDVFGLEHWEVDKQTSDLLTKEIGCLDRNVIFTEETQNEKWGQFSQHLLLQHWRTLY